MSCLFIFLSLLSTLKSNLVNAEAADIKEMVRRTKTAANLVNNVIGNEANEADRPDHSKGRNKCYQQDQTVRSP